MKQDKKKSIYDSKIFWIIFSLVASLALWGYVSSQEPTIITKTLIGVPVQFNGEDTLNEEHGLTISNVANSTVNITIRGSRRIIGPLDSSKVVAMLDVSNITASGDMSWSYSLKYPSGTDASSIQIISKSPETINFTVASPKSKTIDIRGEFTGTMAEGFTADDMVFEPSTITVSGPDEILDRIDYAWVNLSMYNVNSDISKESDFVLIDKNGSEIDKDKLSFSSDTIKVKLPVIQTKEIKLNVELISGAGANASNCTVSIEPQLLKIAGDSSKLSNIDQLIIAKINLSDFASVYEEVIPIDLDESIQNLTGVTEAKVKITVNGLTTKSFTVNNISCSSIPSSINASIITKSLTVTIRGTEAALESLEADKIRVVADLSDYADASGNVSVDAKVLVDGASNVGAIGSYKIQVEITKG